MLAFTSGRNVAEALLAGRFQSPLCALCRAVAQGKEYLLRKLRPYGIYQPPGELRPVYAVPAYGGYYLYDSECGVKLPPRFEVKPDGRVESWHGEPVPWRADDLLDTGETRGAR